jgi:hypothetical protein
MATFSGVIAFVVVFELVRRVAWPFVDACSDLRDCDCPFCSDVERRLSL